MPARRRVGDPYRDGHCERMPEVGRRFYEHVLEKTISRLATYLEARVAAKDLAIDDCQLAAAQFMLMCQASLFLPFVFQAAPPPSPSAWRKWLKAQGGFSRGVSDQARLRPSPRRARLLNLTFRHILSNRQMSARTRILDAAMLVFRRHGFRRSSIEQRRRPPA